MTRSRLPLYGPLMRWLRVTLLCVVALYEAVHSPIAENLWETGKCLEPGPTEAAPIPKLEYTIEFK